VRSAAKSVQALVCRRALARKVAHVVLSAHLRHRAKGAREETDVGGAGGETATTTVRSPPQALLTLRRVL
jgi:hypothetical protein